MTIAIEDVGFRRWASQNARGYVLTHRPSDELMLHFGFCLQLLDDRDGIHVTDARKVCGSDKRDLIQYSFEQTGHAPVRCKTCDP